MKIRKQLAVLAMVMVFMVSTLFAGQGNGQPGHRVDQENLSANVLTKASEVRGMVLSTLVQLDLSKDQKEGIKEIIVSALKENKVLIMNAGLARKAIAEAIHSETFDEQAVRSAFQKMAPYGEELAVVRAKAVSEIKALLTDAQKEKLKQLRSDIRGVFNFSRFFK